MIRPVGDNGLRFFQRFSIGPTETSRRTIRNRAIHSKISVWDNGGLRSVLTYECTRVWRYLQPRRFLFVRGKDDPDGP